MSRLPAHRRRRLGIAGPLGAGLWTNWIDPIAVPMIVAWSLNVVERSIHESFT
ncbi:MAG: hypothetical protein AVDCRST_MAG43-130 [uncultured Thermomicrobiales bacterium]|uniref:Uncharacterized protein n=1 Tax=uncultured Thermomicrobiales bacterium TaxID=1645740 RepID=A0A6J4U877_9BACT|nr:MAG: hypothetical protein AVDCRST_MAG43-130 [uncultured Thermomicrobiales bacterium]